MINEYSSLAGIDHLGVPCFFVADGNVGRSTKAQKGAGLQQGEHHSGRSAGERARSGGVRRGPAGAENGSHLLLLRQERGQCKAMGRRESVGRLGVFEVDLFVHSTHTTCAISALLSQRQLPGALYIRDLKPQPRVMHAIWRLV